MFYFQVLLSQAPSSHIYISEFPGLSEQKPLSSFSINFPLAACTNVHTAVCRDAESIWYFSDYTLATISWFALSR